MHSKAGSLDQVINVIHHVKRSDGFRGISLIFTERKDLCILGLELGHSKVPRNHATIQKPRARDILRRMAGVVIGQDHLLHFAGVDENGYLNSSGSFDRNDTFLVEMLILVSLFRTAIRFRSARG